MFMKYDLLKILLHNTCKIASYNNVSLFKNLFCLTNYHQ